MEIENVILDAISRRIDKKLFDLWFGSKVHFELRESTLFVYSPTPFLSEWREKNFKHVLEQVSRELFAEVYPMRFLVQDSSIQPQTSINSIDSTEDDLKDTKRLRGKQAGKSKQKTKKTLSQQNFVDETENTVNTEKHPLLKFDPEYQEADAETSDKKNRRGRRKNTVLVTSNDAVFVPERDPVSMASLPLEEVPDFSIRAKQSKMSSYDRFVVGKSNRAAKIAADFAIEQPGKLNPIFIYGSTSVGKTCLLEGICSELYKQNRKKPPFFLTANQFTTLFIQNIRGDGSTFRKRFRNISALVIDDLHYLQNRKQTQIALLGLIDYLRPLGVQIIFSSDRSLAEMKDFRSELSSRITSGLVCKIESPERDTLHTILKQMALDLNLSIPDDVCRYVVSCFSTHARQLAGALTRLFAVHQTTGESITLDMARTSLRDLIRCNRKIISLAEVERAVLDVFNISNISLRSKSKAKVYCYPRMLAMWLARKHTNAALSEIGNYFGNRSHSTVLSALKRVDVWLDENAPMERDDQSWNIAETISRIERIIV